METPVLSLSPIGYIRTNMRLKFDAPSQPENSTAEQSVIELLPGNGYERALRDLEGFDRIWLLWWFHKNQNWKPLVFPPRGPAVKRGVFATRSPHRPNPLGITSVPLVSVSGLKVIVGNTDLLDGTPILDIKPYIPNIDAFPEAQTGWLGEVERALAEAPSFRVDLTPEAQQQVQWLSEHWRIDFFSRARTLLERDPSVHPTRRICRLKSGECRMGCGAWRVFFVIEAQRVFVNRVAPGYPLRLLEGEGYERVPDREAQLEFLQLWPSVPYEKASED
jgi:tRNA-Thr(GGU) m(6)t(6)A37 methyltransferase TsaA